MLNIERKFISKRLAIDLRLTWARRYITVLERCTTIKPFRSLSARLIEQNNVVLSGSGLWRQEIAAAFSSSVASYCGGRDGPAMTRANSHQHFVIANEVPVRRSYFFNEGGKQSQR